jgi:hypothetical protein
VQGTCGACISASQCGSPTSCNDGGPSDGGACAPTTGQCTNGYCTCSSNSQCGPGQRCGAGVCVSM